MRPIRWLDPFAGSTHSLARPIRWLDPFAGSTHSLARPIRWLHISDIHMRVSKVWSQDVVLKAMCDDIAKQRKRRCDA